MTYSYSGPMGLTPSLLSLNSSTVSVPFTSPGTPLLPMSLYWTSMSVLITVISSALSTSNPLTPNNTSTTIAVTPHQPNTSSLTPLLLKGFVSVTIPMTSTLTLQTSVEPSLPRGMQSLLFRNSYSMVSITLKLPTPPQNPDNLSLTITCYPGLHCLKRILSATFHILSSDLSTQDLLSKPPSVTFQKPPPLPTHCQYESPPPQN